MRPEDQEDEANNDEHDKVKPWIERGVGRTKHIPNSIDAVGQRVGTSDVFEDVLRIIQRKHRT